MELRQVKKNEPKVQVHQQFTFVCTMLGIVLLALVSASYAWFTLSATNMLDMLSINASSGAGLRFDTVNHGNNYDSYIKHVTAERINEQLVRNGKLTLKELRLDQYTSNNGYEFYAREANENNGDPIAFEVNDGILVVDFWFIAEEDMYVHLSPENEEDSAGTYVRPADDSEASKYAYDSLRISFVSEEGETAIYQPSGFGDTTVIGQAAKQDATKMFSWESEEAFEYTDDNMLFFLEKGKNKKVTMYVWIEGEDPQAINKSENGSVDIDLKFVGTDEFNNPHPLQ